jgi:hypothetical protein
MARTILNETLVPRDTAVDTAAAGVYQTADNTNGMYCNVGVTGAKKKAGTLFLHMKNTNAAARTVTVKAGSGGDAGPAWRAGLGDLVVTVALTSGEQMLAIYDEARFKQADGTILLDISGANVTIAAFRRAGH